MSKIIVPEKMLALQQHKEKAELVLEEVPVPKPGKGEVLVKMAFSPVNPSDLSFLKGTYASDPQYPVIPGIEGSGEVVASGGGLLANLRKGKTVTCSSSEGHGGTWAEYMVTSAMRVIPIDQNISLKQGAMLVVNPMTVLAFISIAKEGKYKAIVNNAASSALGKMMIRLCMKENIPLISIVRKEEQIDELKALGAIHVLNSTANDYEKKLSELMHELEARLIFDAVAGAETEKLIKAAPYGSKLMLYSNMSETNIDVDPRILVQNRKSIDGFYLGGWAKERNILQTLGAAKKAQKLVKEELRSTIRGVYTMREANQAIASYKDNMSAGKVMLSLGGAID